MVYLPQEKIIFTGDMLLGGMSWLGDGFVSEWAETLEKLKQLEFDLILPGHGEAFRDRKHIDHLQHYYDDLYQEIVKLRDDGLSVEQAAERADLTQYADTLGVKQRGASLDAVKRIYQLLE